MFTKSSPAEKMLSVCALVGKNTFVLVQTPPVPRKWHYYVILRNNYVSIGRRLKVIEGVTLALRLPGDVM